MKLPNIISSCGLAVLLFLLNWTLSHIGQFSIPPAYLTMATGLLGVAIAAVAKLVQEKAVPVEINTRGLDGQWPASYLARVLYK